MYRTLNAEFWTDPKVQSLSLSGKLLFLYCITNPHSHYSGIYYCPLELIQLETGIIGRGFDGAWKGLLSLSVIDYDPTLQQLWVRKMLKYQGSGQKTEKGVASHLTTLHPSALIERFLTYYPNIISYLPHDFERYPIDGGSKFPSPVPDPDPDPSSDSVSGLKSKTHTEFEQFWLAYPKKIGKKDALRAWQKATDKPPLVDVLHAIESAKKTEQWVKDNGQFIPHPSTWLNQGRWADQAPATPLSTTEAFLARGASNGTPRISLGLAAADCATLGEGLPQHHTKPAGTRAEPR